MYVILNGSAVVYHDVPNTSQIRDWAKWEIPLQRFADLGSTSTASAVSVSVSAIEIIHRLVAKVRFTLMISG